MKPFLAWFLGTLVAFGVLGGAYHLALAEDPRKVLVIVDSSYPMTERWHRVPKLLEDLGEKRYSIFALMSERGRIHGWKGRLALAQLRPYGPRDFENLQGGEAFPEMREAGEVYFITNAPEAELAAFGDWHILRP